MDSAPFDRIARRYAPVALAIGLIAVVAFVTVTSGLHVRSRPSTAVQPSPVSQTLPTLPPATPIAGPPTTPGPVPAGVTSALRVLFVLACLAVLALLVLLAVRLVRRSGGRRRIPRFPPGAAMLSAGTQAVPELLDAAIAAGLVELADDSDPRGAVINAWVRLERAAEQVGAERAPSDTPADLATRLLAAHAVPADVLAELAGLYRAARYSPHPVDDRMRVDALAALNAVQDALRQPVPSP